MPQDNTKSYRTYGNESPCRHIGVFSDTTRHAAPETSYIIPVLHPCGALSSRPPLCAQVAKVMQISSTLVKEVPLCVLTPGGPLLSRAAPWGRPARAPWLPISDGALPRWRPPAQQRLTKPPPWPAIPHQRISGTVPGGYAVYPGPPRGGVLTFVAHIVAQATARARSDVDAAAGRDPIGHVRRGDQRLAGTHGSHGATA